MPRPDYDDPALLALFLAGRTVRAELDGQSPSLVMALLAKRAGVPGNRIARAAAGNRMARNDRHALWAAMGHEPRRTWE